MQPYRQRSLCGRKDHGNRTFLSRKVGTQEQNVLSIRRSFPKCQYLHNEVSYHYASFASITIFTHRAIYTDCSTIGRACGSCVLHKNKSNLLCTLYTCTIVSNVIAVASILIAITPILLAVEPYLI